MLMILKAQREYEELAWRTYDRDKVAAMGNRKWAQVDALLYNQVFTGRAHRIRVCSHCGNAGHGGDVCPVTDSPSAKRVAASGAPAVAPPQGLTVRATGTARRPSDDICWSFNKSPAGMCRFGSLCKFKHMCSACSGRHPEAACKRKGK